MRCSAKPNGIYYKRTVEDACPYRISMIMALR